MVSVCMIHSGRPVIFYLTTISNCWLGHTVLHDVVTYYFENPEVLSWFLLNWNMLQERKKEMIAVAQTLGFNIVV